MKISRKGFTVLEFLVVVTIIGILIAIVLVSLDLSRQRARDNRRISRLQNVSVALEQFYTDCRTYPIRLDDLSYQCPTPGVLNASGGQVTLKDYIPDSTDDQWNTVGSRFRYLPLTYGSGSNCTGYHLSVELENTGNQYATRDAEFDSTQPGINLCVIDAQGTTPGGSGAAINGSLPGVYDIKR